MNPLGNYKIDLYMRSIAVREWASSKRVNAKDWAAANQECIRATVDWIKRAQDSTRDRGVSAGFYYYQGWVNSYPETTGYIIPTMFDYYHFSGDVDSQRRAFEMSRFLMSIQLGDGSFRFGYYPNNSDPEVFDTGQILQGLVRCFNETKDNQVLASAVRAGNWLLSVQDEDGAWRKNSFRGIPHTYYSRVALALLELFAVTGDERYREASTKNILWTLKNCNEVGWYQNCAFDLESMPRPITHVIAYTVEGVLECGSLLDNDVFVKSAAKTLNALLKKFEVDGWLRGTYDQNWDSSDNYSCLTGDSQIALLWLRLFELTGNQAYFDAAVKVNNYVKSTQYLHHKCGGIQGGIKGSHPIYGDYNPYRFLNWAAKFFIDSLIKQEVLSRKLASSGSPVQAEGTQNSMQLNGQREYGQ